jgi:hypothetical protein
MAQASVDSRSQTFTNFCFLYATMPTAPALVGMSAQYYPAVANMISGGVVLCLVSVGN